MPFLFSEATLELKDAVNAVERRADHCFQLLRLLKRAGERSEVGAPYRHGLGVGSYRQQKSGPNSPLHKVRMVSLDRCTIGFKCVLLTTVNQVSRLS